MHPLPQPKPNQPLEEYLRQAILDWYQAGVRGERLSDVELDYSAESLAEIVRKFTRNTPYEEAVPDTAMHRDRRGSRAYGAQ